MSDAAGYFRFGKGTICYGQSSSGFRAERPTDSLYDALQDVTIEGSTARLPFHPTQVIDNLRYERYVKVSNGNDSRFTENHILRRTYYFLRPLLPASMRKHIQRGHLRDWDKISFPSWPVDRSVDCLLENLLALSLKSHTVDRIPFIWFWPRDFQGCVIMTHDVETLSGRDFCSDLMDIDDSVAIKSSFQIVPERRYPVSQVFLNNIRERGFEVNVHDLNHDGHLFTSRKRFLRRAERINRYGKEFGALGFRAGVMYRNGDWFDALDFSYDMSVPNVAHLEPQRGGCCTVMPFFIGKILELPLTTTQDYSLFHILNDYSIGLWKQQIALITERHGLVSFIVHPDYVIEKRAQDTYKALLEYLNRLRSEGRIWIALPGEVNRWWRERSQMKLVGQGQDWKIEGPSKERARVAYAKLERDHVVFSIDEAS